MASIPLILRADWPCVKLGVIQFIVYPERLELSTPTLKV